MAARPRCAHGGEQLRGADARGDDACALAAVDVAGIGPQPAGDRGDPGEHEAAGAEVVVGVLHRRADLPAARGFDRDEVQVQGEADRKGTVEGFRRVSVSRLAVPMRVPGRVVGRVVQPAVVPLPAIADVALTTGARCGPSPSPQRQALCRAHQRTAAGLWRISSSAATDAMPSAAVIHSAPACQRAKARPNAKGASACAMRDGNASQP